MTSFWSLGLGGPSGTKSVEHAKAFDDAPPLSEAAIMREVRGLATGFPERIFGTKKGQEASEYLADRLRDIGLRAVGESFFQEFEADPGRKSYDKGMAKGRNVAGMIVGTDPKVRDEVVIVSAHFDSQPHTKEGANDNASGVAGVLTLARLLKQHPPRRSVVFLFFDGEECGKKGSKHYADRPLHPINKTALMLNMDMIGQVHLEGGRRTDVFQWASDDPLARGALEKASARTLGKNEKAIAGYPELPYESQFFSTDAEPLYRLGVPVVNLLSGKDLDNHSRADAMDHVIPSRIAQYVRLAHQVAVEAANDQRSISAILGKEPGGLMPSFPLIAHRKETVTKNIAEEKSRISELDARVPRFRDLAGSIVRDIQWDLKPGTKLFKRAGITADELRGKEWSILTENAINIVREKHAALLDQYHEIPKDEVEKRRELADRLEALSGIEGVLSGSLFLAKLGWKNNDYTISRIPEKLRELSEGAAKLGFADRVARTLADSDVASFKTAVTPERALEIAETNVFHLVPALGRAVLALIDPELAAKEDRTVKASDLKDLEKVANKGNAAAKARTRALIEVVNTTLELDDMTGFSGLKRGASISKVAEKLETMREPLKKLADTDAVLREVDFWIDWLKSFIAIEPVAERMRAQREAATKIGWDVVSELWTEMKAKIPDEQKLSDREKSSPLEARRAFRWKNMSLGLKEFSWRDKDPVAARWERICDPLADLQEVLDRADRGDMREAIARLPRLREVLSDQFSAAQAKPLKDCLAALKMLEMKQNVIIGDAGDRAVVRVLDVR
jgi:hypothetical protein